jgi:Lon protease-like protein
LAHFLEGAVASYPNRLGVLLSPGVVLFPHAHVPLHVYRSGDHALVADAEREDGRLVLAVPAPDEEYEDLPEIHSTACAAHIVRHQRLNDDVSNIILRGERVVRIREIQRLEPYWVATVDPAPPEQPPSSDVARARVSELRTLIERCCPGTFEKLEHRLSHTPEEDGGLELLNTLASSLPVGVDQKLMWLDCGGPQARWEALRETLICVAEAREQRARTIRRYSDLRPGRPGHN